MSDRVTSLLDAENEMAEAITRLNAAMDDFKRLDRASATVESLSSTTNRILQALQDVTVHLKDGATLLTDEGIAKFEAELRSMTQQVASTRTDLEAVAKSLNEGVTRQFQELQNSTARLSEFLAKLETSSKAALESMASQLTAKVESKHEETTALLNSLHQVETSANRARSKRMTLFLVVIVMLQVGSIALLAILLGGR